MNFFGIILGTPNEVFSVVCDILPSSKGSNFSVTSLNEDDVNKVLTFSKKSFFEFWKKYCENEHYYHIHLHTSKIFITNKDNLPSISLSVFMTPLLCSEKFSTSYTHVCFSGIVDDECKCQAVGRVTGKYGAYSKYVNNKKLGENPNNKIAFVYVSNEEIDFSEVELNTKIRAIRILPGDNVESVIHRLSSTFLIRSENFLEFNNAVFFKLSSALMKNNSKNKIFSAEIFLSGNDSTKKFFDFNLFGIFRLAIDTGYKFSLTVNISKFLSNSEITSDNINVRNLKPLWWNDKELSDENMVKINDRLKRIDLFVSDQIKGLKRYVFESYAYEDVEPKISGKLKIDVNYCNNEAIRLTGEKITENALIIKLNDETFVSYTEADYFGYNVYKKNEDFSKNILDIKEAFHVEQKIKKTDSLNNEEVDSLLNILNSLELKTEEKFEKIGNILKELRKNGKYLPKFTLYGLPGTGKSSILKEFMKFYEDSSKSTNIDVRGIYVISSDFIINERIFDDDLNSRHNPNEKARNKDIDAIKEHVIYSRADYKKFFLDTDDVENRNLCVKIAINQSKDSHNFLDLGGKEILIEETRYLLNELGFITIFLCPDGNPEDESVILSQNNTINDYEPYFDAYYEIFKKYPILFDEKKRRNICDLVESSRKNENGQNEPKIGMILEKS